MVFESFIDITLYKKADFNIVEIVVYIMDIYIQIPMHFKYKDNKNIKKAVFMLFSYISIKYIHKIMYL